MKWNETLVRLNFCLFKDGLILKRTPKYLRFVVVDVAGGDRTWDALDQMDDDARPEETVFAAIQIDASSVHIDKRVNGKHVGEWHKTATYELIKGQPSDTILRVNSEWQRWASDQQRIAEDAATNAS